MFHLASVLLLFLLITQVADAPNILPHEEAPSNCVHAYSKWTLFNIVWGCVSTTIICAWAALHPNIPPREGPFKGTLRRLELMFWTIVTPEILPAWALNQLLAAKSERYVQWEERFVADLFRESSQWNKGQAIEKVWDLEDCEGMVFIVRNHGGCESRWVFEWHLWLWSVKRPTSMDTEAWIFSDHGGVSCCRAA